VNSTIKYINPARGVSKRLKINQSQKAPRGFELLLSEIRIASINAMKTYNKISLKPIIRTMPIKVVVQPVPNSSIRTRKNIADLIFITC
jgi:hypothetical protein